MTPIPSKQRWLLAVDGRRGSLFSVHRNSGNDIRLEHAQSLTNTHEEEHEHHRPALLGGAERRGTAARSGAAAAPHSVAATQADEEELLRFAREVAAWFTGLKAELGIKNAVVFAPARFLGRLRHELHESAGTRLLEGDFAHLPSEELSAHPVLKAALSV